MTRPDLTRLSAAALPVLAIVAFLLFLGATLTVSGDTLGYDFLAYHQAAQRVLDGQPLYDTSFQASGGFGLFYYPPAFLPLILPFGMIEAAAATWAWIAILIVAFLIGVAILPVSRSVRWWIVLLAGLSFPFVYAVKLGQVGPLLFLAFAIGWRWLDDPRWLGASAAVGAAIKLQPGIVLVWAVLTRRWAAVLSGIIVLAALALIATALAGITAWTDFFALVRQVSDPITTEHNFTPGAVAYQLGATTEVAGGIQLISTVAVVLAVVFAAWRAAPEASFLVAVIASQLVSPILWDHYAVILLLPVAYLLSKGLRWAIAIPLVTSVPLVGITPPIVYPVVFFVALAATVAVGLRESPHGPGRSWQPVA